MGARGSARALLAGSVVAALGVVAVAIVPSVAAAAAPNLLTVNQASVESDLAGIEHGYYAETITRTTATAADGVASASLASTGTGGMAARTTPQPASAGTTYTASVAARTASASVQALVQLRFWSSTGTALGAFNGPWTAIGPTSWVTASRTGVVAPAGAATVSVFLVVASTSARTTVYADQWGLWAASAPPPWSLPGATSTPTTPAPTTTASPTTAPPTTAPPTTPPPTSAPPTSAPPTTAPPTTSPTPLPAGSNLLTPNQASLESSISGLEPSYGALSVGRTTTAAHDGQASLAITANAAGSLAVRTLRGWTPVSGGTAYSAGVQVLGAGGVAVGERVLAQVRFWGATGSQVGSTINGPWTALTASWTRVGVAGVVAPTGAASVSLMLVTEKSVAGDVYDADEWGVFASSSLPAWSLPTTSTRPVVVFLGDSITAGGSASATLLRWSSLVAAQKGWLENNMARGGTGYVQTSGPSGCGLAYCPSIREMAAQAVAAQADVVVVSGGRNDLAAYGTNPAAVQQAIADTFATLRAGLPHATIIAVTPLWDASTPSTKFPTMGQWIQDAGTAAGATVVPDAWTWLVGHPEWISADKVHPNDLGHQQIAQHVLAALG